MQKSNSISQTESEPRRGLTTAPQTHSGPTGPPGKAQLQRRRLRAPCWARSMSQTQNQTQNENKKLLPFFIIYQIFLHLNFFIFSFCLTNKMSFFGFPFSVSLVLFGIFHHFKTESEKICVLLP